MYIYIYIYIYLHIYIYISSFFFSISTYIVVQHTYIIIYIYICFFWNVLCMYIYINYIFKDNIYICTYLYVSIFLVCITLMMIIYIYNELHKYYILITHTHRTIVTGRHILSFTFSRPQSTSWSKACTPGAGPARGGDTGSLSGVDKQPQCLLVI